MTSGESPLDRGAVPPVAGPGPDDAARASRSRGPSRIGPSSLRVTTTSSQARVSGRVSGRMKKKPDDVGDEARREQQGAADEHQRGVGELPARHPPGAQRLLQRRPGPWRPHA